MVIIQLIYVTWTPKSRGAPEAIRRNAVAKSLPLQLVQSQFLFEKYYFGEPDFAKGEPVDLIKDCMPEKIDSLFLEFQNEELIVGFHYNYYEIGKPGRYDKRPALRLRPGQYGRLMVNGRHSIDDIEGDPNW